MPMPETAMHKYGPALPAVRQIRSTWKIPIVKPVSKAVRGEDLTDGQLWGRPGTTYAPHPSRCSRCRF